MIKTDKNKEKLLRKLKELLQLDQPDLDFGFYRIMQSRKEETCCIVKNDNFTRFCFLLEQTYHII